ncbi:unnamed protein product [Dracunculus medinensis]|uniref:DOMON domain-containing protein n=1 Tax=Dracunculus medinensis TaxID=318479 RepID=A0A0N4UQF2_DRAME|nr:unnamed protein product [Dracunculus medinensis]
MDSLTTLICTLIMFEYAATSVYKIECHFKLKYADETGTISAIGSIQYQNLKYSINSWNHDNTFESGISLELIGGIAAGFVDDRGFFI